jgi:superfamily II RNA helicase
MDVHIVNTKFEGLLDSPFTFPLDDFQKHAIKLLQNDDPKNILVTAHTGSGKSLVAEYAIIRGIKELGKKIIYCSPIKSLSNQKMYEFSKKYSDISIGLITGDHKCNPNADCLIMTTEILCILLEKKAIKYDDFEINDFDFDNIFAIVFDEVHYINDVERGGVWEKCIMNVPKNINQIMLSATIDSAHNFINWIYTCNNNPSYLLTNDKRVVPLHFNYAYYVNTKKLTKDMEHFNNKLNTFTPFTSTNSNHIEQHQMKPILDLDKIFKNIKVNPTYIINEICKDVDQKNMTPALFFIFSKKKCMDIAKNITMTFNDYNEGIEVNRSFDYYLSKLENKEGYKNSQQYNEIRDLAVKGIGVHHAGLIPVFKEIIEMLFSKNLIKILIATETFAVGLNSPIKTVIFTDIYKYDNKGKRRLLTHEFIQMSGRAGRRGIDTIGYVILVPQLFSEDMRSSDLDELIFGKAQKIVSKLNIDHNLIIQMIENNKLDNLKEIISKSLLNAEIKKELDSVINEIDRIKEKRDKIQYDSTIFEEYQRLEDQITGFIKPSNNQIKKIEQKIKDIKKDEKFKKEFVVYEEYTNYNKEINKLDVYKLELLEYIEQSIKNQINKLINKGFVEENENMYKLTQRGEIANKINEIDSLVTTNIIMSDFLDNLFFNKKDYKIVGLFTLLCDGKDNDYIEINDEYYDIMKFLRNQDMSENILLNRELLLPVLDWYDGKNSREIIEIYDIHEGDLIKCINKVIHILDEVSSVFLLLNKLEYIEILDKIKIKLNRDIIKMESLYLRI